MTVRSLVDQIHSKDKTFVVFPGEGELTYEQLPIRSQAISNYFGSLGLQKGDVVSLALTNGVAAVELFIAAQYGGFVISFLNLVGQSQWEYILSHSQPRLIISDPQFSEKLTDNLSNIKEQTNKDIIHVHDSNRSFYQSISTDVTESKAQGVNDVSSSGQVISENDPAILMYTSGTTGKPKGVLLSQKNSIAGGKNTAVGHQIGADDVGLCVLPLYHINAQMVSLMSTLVAGSSLVLPCVFKVSEFWKIVSDYKCTWFSLVPTQINYLIHRSEIDNLDISSLKFGRSASAPLAPEVHKNFEEKFGINIVETMGLTETAAQILSNPRDPKKQKYGTPGTGVGNEIKIVDENLKRLAVGEVGELAVKGDNVMIGYLNNPEATASTIVDGWLMTGDLGYVDGDGFVFITGRKKEIIIKGGENIAPREIDDVLYLLPEVIEAASFGVPCENYGQKVEAAVVLRNDAQTDEESILKFCEEKIGSFKKPDRIYFLNELPKGPSGKIQRNKISDLV